MLPTTPLTKKQMGYLVLVASVAGAVGVLGVDLLGAGQFGGLGPAQWQALGGCGLLALFGASLTFIHEPRDVPVQPRLSFKDLPPFWRWLILGLFGLALLALAFELVVYLHYTISLLRFPFDYDQGEGFELYDTLLHAQWQWPYRDSQAFPFYTSIYPPFFHILTVPLVWLFGSQMWTGRLVGFAASLLASAAIGWGVWRASGNRIIALLAGLTFLASNYTFHIGPLFRQHMTMVMFETVGIVALAQVDGTPRPIRRHRALWLGLACLLAAGYTKQLALATVVAGFISLFVINPRRAVLLGALFAGIAGGIFLWINLATEGWWYVSIIRANINAFDQGQAVSFYRQWLELHGVIATLALARLVYEIYWTRLSGYAIWFALAFVNGALSGKFGAGESYFVTTTAAACVLAGIALAKVWERASIKQLTFRIGLLVIPLLFLFQTRLTWHMYTDGFYAPLAQFMGLTSERGYYDSQGYTQLGPRPTRADHEAGQRIADLARVADGPVFSEEAAFVLVAGKPVITNAFPQLVMYQAGLFDPRQEIAQIEAKGFGLVILRAQFYPPPVLQALGVNYQPLTDIWMNNFQYRILERRP